MTGTAEPWPKRHYGDAGVKSASALCHQPVHNLSQRSLGQVGQDSLNSADFWGRSSAEVAQSGRTMRKNVTKIKAWAKVGWRNNQSLKLINYC